MCGVCELLCVTVVTCPLHRGVVERHSLGVLDLLMWCRGWWLLLLTQSILGWAPVALGLGVVVVWCGLRSIGWPLIAILILFVLPYLIKNIFLNLLTSCFNGGRGRGPRGSDIAIFIIGNIFIFDNGSIIAIGAAYVLSATDRRLQV